MSTWLRAALVFTAPLAIGAAAFSCGTVRGLYDACGQADDCVAPFVCCTAPRIPAYGQKIPYCESTEYCDGFMPPLIEDNPCHRVPEGGPAQECSEGLECCPESLTCKSKGSCTGTVVTPVNPSSGGKCVADEGCSGGEVCCGISLFYRLSGTCKTIPDCAPPPTG